MEHKEAKEFILNFKYALSRLESDAGNYYIIQNQYKKLEDRNKELQKERKQLENFQRYFNLLNSVSTFMICPVCDGYCGFEYDLGEQGGHSEMCNNCEGTGIVDKQTE